MKKLIIIIGVLLLCGCSSDIKYSKSYFYMDTVINIDIYSNKEDILLEVENIYKEYHNLTTRYDNIKDLVNIYYINNILKVNKEIKIDSRLYELLEYSKEVYIKTNKKVNIGLGNVIDVWNEYKNKIGGIPSYNQLLNSGSTNLDDLVLLGDNTIKKTSNIKLDLGAISKGYTTNIVKEYLEENNIDKYLINAGGNVVVGNHYNNSLYKIGLQDPINNMDVYKVLNLTNKAVVTSGSYIRGYEYEGVIYHHIIDSIKLFPMDYFKSVTVICDDSAQADALSTYLFTIPYEEGLNIVESLPGVEVIWYIDSTNIKYTKGVTNYE